jgi:hypothetical protein
MGESEVGLFWDFTRGSTWWLGGGGTISVLFVGINV